MVSIAFASRLLYIIDRNQDVHPLLIKKEINVIKVEHSIVINRPVPEVFAFVTGPANNTKWQGAGRIAHGVFKCNGSRGASH